MKKLLFIDRDGTLVLEPEDYQVDSFQKLKFYPQVFTYLSKIAKELDYELVTVTNQDGLGTASHPEENFWPIQNFIIETFENEDVKFEDIFIDKTFAKDNAPTRKPNTGMLEILLKDFGEHSKSQMIMIGDASGKLGDFSDSDKKCAENFGIDYLDVEDFLNDKSL